jgi:hypothetical protein
MTGHNYERDCRALGLEPEGSGKAGKVLGIVGTVLLAIGCGCGGLWFLVGMATGFSS